MSKCNLDIRESIKISGLTHWMVAYQLGITDTTFSRWLRKELPLEKKRAILEAIEEVKEEHGIVS